MIETLTLWAATAALGLSIVTLFSKLARRRVRRQLWGIGPWPWLANPPRRLDKFWSPEPIEAVRTVTVQALMADGEPHPTSPPGWRWADREGWVTAICDPSRRPIDERRTGKHRAPDPGCTCGLYAWKPDAAPPEIESVTCYDAPGERLWVVTIPVIVELAGRVIEHERGFRAEKIRIVERRPNRALDLDRSLHAEMLEQVGLLDEARLVLDAARRWVDERSRR